MPACVEVRGPWNMTRALELELQMVKTVMCVLGI